MLRRGERVESIPPGLERSIPVFDRATRLAKTLLGAADAQISLITEAGVWRSRAGLRAGDQDQAAVMEIVRTRELTWVEDASQDPRFRDMPEVVNAPHIRFLAGAPISLEDGVTCGALWVAGLHERPYDRSLASRLQDLADFVADEWARQRAAEARDTFEQTLIGVIDALPTSTILLDRELKAIHASRHWMLVTGMTREAIVGQCVYELLPMYDRWRADLERCLAGQSYSIERLPIRRDDGSTDWVKVEMQPWRTAAGDVGGIIIATYDLTTMVQAVERMERTEERLNLALEIADLHVYEMDYLRGELIKSGAEETLFERPRTFEDMAQDIYSTIDPRDRADVEAAWATSVREGTRFRVEHRIPRSDGREVWCAATASLITSSSGKPIRLVGAVQNITDRRIAEQALLQAKEDAEAANRSKSEFLANMSHEIRTPLNGVLGMAQAMAAEPLSDVQRARLDVIRVSGESLLSILNDVLDLSKVEAGKLELESAPFDLDELVRAAHATFSAVAEHKGLCFDLAVAPSASGAYRGDAVRVRQILCNLVSNALKFTEQGRVRVRVSRAGADLRFTVADTGIGIEPEQRRLLFGKFEQADASTTRRFGGTGLGLAICRELAQLMCGRISVRSRPGKGTTFTVSLPLEKVDRVAAAPSAEPRSAVGSGDLERPLKVLAAEDNAMNQLVLKTLLAQVGVEPEIVGDGRQAVAAWEREPWDLILMDVQMPVMDGPTATLRIRARELEGGRPRTPILALTANAMSHQVAEYLRCGMDAVVPKPIEARRLYETMQAAVESAQPQVGETEVA